MQMGPAINSASIRQGLLSESGFKPNTGTAGGDRAAQDFARQQQYAATAKMNRDMAKSNAQTYGQRQQQGEQMAQAWKNAQMQRMKSLMGYKSQQTSYAAKLLESQINRQSDWETSLIGMIG